MKNERIYLRVTEDQKEEIKTIAKNLGYDKVSEFIVDSTLNRIGKKQSDENGNLVHVMTVSPSIDYYVNMTDKELGIVNNFYASEREFVPGGQGINTSLVLKKFKCKNITVHHSSGFTGEYIWGELNRMGINQKVIKSQGTSRINVKVVNEDGDLSFYNQIVEPLSEYAKDQMIEYVRQINKEEIFVLSGSFRDEDAEFVKQLLRDAKQNSSKLIIDIKIGSLEKVLKNIEPDLLVVTKKKLQTITKKEILESLDKYIKLGVKNVSIIEDINFIFFANEEKKFLIETPIERTQTIVGTSDSLAGAFIAKSSEDIMEMLKWIGATVKAKSSNPTHFTFEEIVDCKKNITIKEL